MLISQRFSCCVLRETDPKIAPARARGNGQLFTVTLFNVSPLPFSACLRVTSPGRALDAERAAHGRTRLEAEAAATASASSATEAADHAEALASALAAAEAKSRALGGELAAARAARDASGREAEASRHATEAALEKEQCVQGFRRRRRRERGGGGWVGSTVCSCSVYARWIAGCTHTARKNISPILEAFAL